MKISACIITLNEEENLRRCIASIAGVVDEIVVVDSGSRDKTVQVAKRTRARVIHQSWMGYVDQKNFAIDHAAHPWVLSIDADEELSPELIEAIQILRANCPEEPNSPVGYQVSRLVSYREKWIYHGDWYPDKLVRIFKKDCARFTGGRVHERLEVTGKCAMLQGHLHHYTYKNAEDRNQRIKNYAQLWAEGAFEAGKSASPLASPTHSFVRFLRGYILKLGFLDGAVGWDIAMGNAREVWLKYQILGKLKREGLPAEASLDPTETHE